MMKLTKMEYKKIIFAILNNLQINMSGNLSVKKVGSLKSTRRIDPVLPTSYTTQQPIANTNIDIPQELSLISQIPESRNFLIIENQNFKILNPDIIPDVIFLLQYEGANAFFQTLPKDDNGNILGQNTQPINPESLLQILPNTTWESFLSSLYPYTQLQPQELSIRILNAGIAPLSVILSQYDPQNPFSIIFKHPSQKAHAKTLEVEIEIIRNEPDVTESATEQCVCGSRFIRTQTVQTRGGDESSTIFAQCAKCRIKWRFSAA